MSKYSSDSELQIESICSVRILDILEVIRRFSVIEKSFNPEQSGSRQSHRHPPGLSHLIERFAYGPTKITFNSRDQLQEFLDLNGGHCDALSDRERVAKF